MTLYINVENTNRILQDVIDKYLKELLTLNLIRRQGFIISKAYIFEM